MSLFLVNLQSLTQEAQGRIQDFFRRGRTRLLLYFNTNKPHTSCIRRPQVISGGGGGGRVRTPCTLPLDPPLHLRGLSIQPQIPEILVGNQMERTNSIRSDRNICDNL